MWVGDCSGSLCHQIGADVPPPRYLQPSLQDKGEGTVIQAEPRGGVALLWAPAFAVGAITGFRRFPVLGRRMRRPYAVVARFPVWHPPAAARRPAGANNARQGPFGALRLLRASFARQGRDPEFPSDPYGRNLCVPRQMGNLGPGSRQPGRRSRGAPTFHRGVQNRLGNPPHVFCPPGSWR